MILLESEVFFFTKWRNAVRKMLMNVLLELCLQLIHLMFTGNVYVKRLLNVLRPANTPPTRHALSTHFLDAEFNRVWVKVKQIIEEAECIAIISDGWLNVWIINYIISTPQPLLYKSTDTRDNRHTGLYIADELKAVINDLGPQKVFALVTDNAANMKAAWSKVEEAYPHITPIGCAAHAWNLKDIMALKTVDTLYKRAKEMVRYVKRHQVIAAIFLTKQGENNKITTLKLPSKTRCHHVWQSPEGEGVSPRNGHITVCRYGQPHQEDPPGWCILGESGKQPETPETYSSSHCTDWGRQCHPVWWSDSACRCKRINPYCPAYFTVASSRGNWRSEMHQKREDFCLKPIHTPAYMLDPKYAGKSILSGAEINKPVVSSQLCLVTLAWMRARFLAVWRSSLPRRGLEWRCNMAVVPTYLISHLVEGTLWIWYSFHCCLHHPPNPTNISQLRAQLVLVWEHTYPLKHATGWPIQGLKNWWPSGQIWGIFSLTTSSTRLESDSEDEASESDVQEVDIKEFQAEDTEAWKEDNQSFSF